METKRNINAGQKARNADSTFAAGGVSSSADSFAAGESAVFSARAFVRKRPPTADLQNVSGKHTEPKKRQANMTKLNTIPVQEFKLRNHQPALA